MGAHAALAVVAVIALLGSAVAAGEVGVFKAPNGGNVNLGTLTPGQNGTVKASAIVSISNSTEYKIQKTSEDRIGSVFSTLQMTVSINGITFNMTHEQENAKIFLKNGSYRVTMSLTYKVKQIVSSVNGSNVPFVFLQPVSNETEDNATGELGDQLNSTDNLSGSDVASSNGNISSNIVTTYEQSDNSTNSNNNSNPGRITLFTLTFKVNASSGNTGEQETGDSSKSQDSLSY